MNDAKFVKNEDPFTLFLSFPSDYQFFYLKTKSTPRFFSIPLRLSQKLLLYLWTDVLGCPAIQSLLSVYLIAWWALTYFGANGVTS